VRGGREDFAFARSEEIALPAEGRVDGVRVIAAAGADFDLEIVDSSGRPVPDVSIKLQEKDASPPVEAEGTTGLDGSWRIRRLPPGRYRISARSGRRSVQETVHWTLGGERITLPLPD
jgi:hypothetical protein